VAAKTKPAKKPAAKAAKKSAKPVAKAKAPARKPAAKAVKATKPVAKSKPTAAKAKSAPAKAKTAAKPKSKPIGKSAKLPAKPTKTAAKPATKAKPAPAKRPTKPTAKPAPATKSKAAAKPVAQSAAAAAKATPATTTKKSPATTSKKKTAGNAMPSTTTSRAAAAVPKPAPAPRDVGVRATAVKSNRPPPNSEPNITPLPERVDLPEGYRPKAGEEYMGQMQLEYFRQKLMNWRADLVEESKQTIDNLRDEVRDVGDDAERATRETENSLELRTRDRYRKLISKIDKALKRIDDGAYGYCEETGEEIGIDRLEARPIATLCLDAQERWEHRQKLMGD
jgi:DnaK suppressor protein